MKIILASNSIRRKELLTEYGYDFKVVPSFEEENKKDLPAYELVKYLSSLKAESVFKNIQNKNDILVIGADTVVEYQNQIIGKPKDEREAFCILKKLSGKTHNVYTGITVVSACKKVSEYVKSEVEFRELDDEFINDYINTKSPMDKAGAYGIQDGKVVKEYRGSYTNIVGLPMERLSQILKEFNKE